MEQDLSLINWAGIITSCNVNSIPQIKKLDALIWVNTCCHVGNLESVRSQLEQDPSLINRAGIVIEHHIKEMYHNLESVRCQLEQDPSLINRAGIVIYRIIL